MPPRDDHQVPPEPVPDNDPLPDQKPAPEEDPVPDHNPLSDAVRLTAGTHARAKAALPATSLLLF
jgi:hypothetical protein